MSWVSVIKEGLSLLADVWRMHQQDLAVQREMDLARKADIDRRHVERRDLSKDPRPR